MLKRALMSLLLTSALAAGAIVAGGVPASAAPAPPRPDVTFSTAPDALSRYQGQVVCDPSEKPGPTAMRELLRRTYGVANAGGTGRDCGQGGRSEHKEGRAYDWMLDVGDPKEKEIADSFVAWLTGKDSKGVQAGNARRLGIMYVIWNKRIWGSYSGGWEAYTGSQPHTDHVHMSFSWDGAFKRTSWWTGTAVTRPDYGPCQVYIGEPIPRPTASTPNYAPCAPPVPRIAGVVTGDFNGDGRTEMGTYRGGQFVLRVSGRDIRFSYGRAGDVPVAGDWNGDGTDGIGVFRDGTWYVRNTLSSGPSWKTFTYGRAGDTPVVGSWDGRAVGVGVVRDAEWILRTGVGAGPATVRATYGKPSDLPVVGDWDGDGREGLGVYRGGTWVLAHDARGASPRQTVRFGHAEAIPAVGDWNGDRRTTLGVVRLTEFVWSDDLGAAQRRTSGVPF